jgi:hypothetical protein
MKGAQELLKNNPDKKEVHVTSDGYKFWTANFAEAHASRLADKTITVVTREDINAKLPNAKTAPVSADATPAAPSNEGGEKAATNSNEGKAASSPDEAAKALPSKEETAPVAKAPVKKSTSTSTTKSTKK